MSIYALVDPSPSIMLLRGTQLLDSGNKKRPTRLRLERAAKILPLQMLRQLCHQRHNWEKTATPINFHGNTHQFPWQNPTNFHGNTQPTSMATRTNFHINRLDFDTIEQLHAYVFKRIDSLLRISTLSQGSTATRKKENVISTLTQVLPEQIITKYFV